MITQEPLPSKQPEDPNPAVSQFDLFPERVTVDRVDARAAAGTRSTVKAIFVVKYERQPGRHQVFHDKHGWYCADHGPACAAVGEARRVTIDD